MSYITQGHSPAIFVTSHRQVIHPIWSERQSIADVLYQIAVQTSHPRIPFIVRMFIWFIGLRHVSCITQVNSPAIFVTSHRQVSHPIWSERQSIARHTISYSSIDPPSSSTRHPTEPSLLYFIEVNWLWKNYNVAAYLCAI